MYCVYYNNCLQNVECLLCTSKIYDISFINQGDHTSFTIKINVNLNRMGNLNGFVLKAVG